ncbi:MAG: hypothetical protein LBK23_01300 [Oscillospiraceae bacterium]|nr:hypothetical protein [Oscillospiraceae bacterium]
MSYMLRSGAGREIEKPEFLEMMDDVWEFVTPTMGGLPTTGHLIERIEKYIAASGGDFSAASGFPVGVREFAVSGKPSERPGFAGAAEFIGAALDDDVPVAFLCLDDGGETALDEWHWTTLVALDAGEDSATAMIIDSGRLFEVDLYKWYHGNKKGGGFVAMTR